MDIADGKAIFSEIGEGSDKFWDDIYKIGEEHLVEYQDKGLRTVREKKREGLCSNCKHRETCTYPNARNNVLHCEEYE